MIYYIFYRVIYLATCLLNYLRVSDTNLVNKTREEKIPKEFIIHVVGKRLLKRKKPQN